MTTDRIDDLINYHNLHEYKDRNFCKVTSCSTQVEIDHITESSGKEVLKNAVCRKHCKAYKFHKWLKEKGYRIVRG